MNILLTSAGRRNYMVTYFREALEACHGQVFVVNSSLDSAAAWLADGAAQSPLIYDASYVDFLLEYCLENKIEIVIPLFDIDLPVMARCKDLFAAKGIRIIVADSCITDIANDKWKTQQFLLDNNLKTVPVYASLADFEKAFNQQLISFPLYVKPRWGMGSIAVYQANNKEELLFYYRKAKSEIAVSYLKYESETDLESSVLIQAVLPGSEYGLDVINDLEGNYCNTIVKKKLAMRSGETDTAITVFEPELVALGQKLSNLTKHPANMDVDVFWDGNTAYVLELNPRFGGGYPFSHQAGVHLPQAIINWHLKQEVDPKELLTAKSGIKSAKGITIIQEDIATKNASK